MDQARIILLDTSPSANHAMQRSDLRRSRLIKNDIGSAVRNYPFIRLDCQTGVSAAVGSTPGFRRTQACRISADQGHIGASGSHRFLHVSKNLHLCQPHDPHGQAYMSSTAQQSCYRARLYEVIAHLLRSRVVSVYAPLHLATSSERGIRHLHPCRTTDSIMITLID